MHHLSTDLPRALKMTDAFHGFASIGLQPFSDILLKHFWISLSPWMCLMCGHKHAFTQRLLFLSSRFSLSLLGFVLSHWKPVLMCRNRDSTCLLFLLLKGLPWLIRSLVEDVIGIQAFLPPDPGRNPCGMRLRRILMTSFTQPA